MIRKNETRPETRYHNKIQFDSASVRAADKYAHAYLNDVIARNAFTNYTINTIDRLSLSLSAYSRVTKTYIVFGPTGNRDTLTSRIRKYSLSDRCEGRGEKKTEKTKENESKSEKLEY